MKQLQEDKDRTIVPRWRPSVNTQWSSELNKSKSQSSPRDIDAEQRAILEWTIDPSLGTAADLISTVSAIQHPEIAKDAAEYILNLANISPTLHAAAMGILNPDHHRPREDSTNPRLQLSHLKARRGRFLKDAYTYLDLARLYCMLGQRRKAARCIEVALNLSPNDRHVLRSCSRFYIHCDELERAYDLLRVHPLSRLDPWVMAAEIAAATASGVTSLLVTKGRKRLNAGEDSPFDLGELASAVGTSQLMWGDVRGGKRSVRTSLVAPTENVVAQAAWTSRRFGAVAIEDVPLDMSAEAQAWDGARLCNWNACIEEADAWLRDQPFSSRPAILGSYVASVAIGDFQKAAAFAMAGFQANPGSFSMRNNAAFALAELDRPDLAAKLFAGIDIKSIDSSETTAFLATSGLIAIRQNDRLMGKKLYIAAIDNARENGDDKRLLLAQSWYANELMRFDVPGAHDLLKNVQANDSLMMYPDVQALVSRIKNTSLNTIILK